MEILNNNPTLFTSVESARSTLPDDHDSDNDSDKQSSIAGPYTKRLGARDVRELKERARREERKELKGVSRRSRKRTHERSRRVRDRGPGERPGQGNQEDDSEEPHLYMTEEEREEYKEEIRRKQEAEEAAAAGAEVDSDVEDGDENKTQKEKKIRRSSIQTALVEVIRETHVKVLCASTVGISDVAIERSAETLDAGSVRARDGDEIRARTLTMMTTMI